MPSKFASLRKNYIMPRMKKFLKNILNFLLPPRCVCCGKILESEDDLCPDCFRQVNFISEPYCRRCGMPFADMTGANADMLCPNCVKNKKNFFRFKRSAVKYDELTFDKAMEDHLKVMDQTAFALCREGNMPIIVFDMNEEGNLSGLIKGEKIGTLVHV